MITDAFPRFHSTPSLQVLLLLATQWPVRTPVKLLEWSPVEALQFHFNTQSHWSSGSTVCFPSRGSADCVPGMHKLTMEPGFSCSHCLATALYTKVRLLTVQVVRCTWHGAVHNPAVTGCVQGCSQTLRMTMIRFSNRSRIYGVVKTLHKILI